MRASSLAQVVLYGLIAVTLGGGRFGLAQIGSAAPTILQSVVLHPCATATVCGTARDGEQSEGGQSVIAPGRSSGSMSGRLTATGLPESPGGSTRYVANPAVSAQVQAAFVRGLEGKLNGAQAEAIARSLEHSDPVARWSGMVSGDGLRTGDLADALASYWVLNWAMANGIATTPATMQAVREQVRWAVANHASLRRLTDAQKQAMAEEAMLNFEYEVTGYLQARQADNEAMLQRFAKGAELRFRNEMAVDLKSLLLTSRGFEAKR